MSGNLNSEDTGSRSKRTARRSSPSLSIAHAAGDTDKLARKNTLALCKRSALFLYSWTHILAASRPRRRLYSHLALCLRHIVRPEPVHAVCDVRASPPSSYSSTCESKPSWMPSIAPRDLFSRSVPYRQCDEGVVSSERGCPSARQRVLSHATRRAVARRSRPPPLAPCMQCANPKYSLKPAVHPSTPRSLPLGRTNTLRRRAPPPGLAAPCHCTPSGRRVNLADASFAYYWDVKRLVSLPLSMISIEYAAT